jgi:hypothetical protein
MPMNNTELPSFTLRQHELPEMLKWQVGGKYYIVMKVEQTGIRNRQDIGEGNMIEADFKVIAVKAVGDKAIDARQMEHDEFESMVGKIKQGEY